MITQLSKREKMLKLLLHLMGDDFLVVQLSFDKYAHNPHQHHKFFLLFSIPISYFSKFIFIPS